jgi:hypothetical protein
MSGCASNYIFKRMTEINKSTDLNETHISHAEYTCEQNDLFNLVGWLHRKLFSIWSVKNIHLYSHFCDISLMELMV